MLDQLCLAVPLGKAAAAIRRSSHKLVHTVSKGLAYSIAADVVDLRRIIFLQLEHKDGRYQADLLVGHACANPYAVPGHHKKLDHSRAEDEFLILVNFVNAIKA